ncbi:MAG: hypothetical protein ACXW00_07585 [Methylobacter sp.]
MLEARELCKLLRYVAADRLGITDKALYYIETGFDVEYIPLKLVRQASLIYDVSCDYLMGFSDDWEVCEEVKMAREIGAWVHHEHIKMFAEWAAKQMYLEQQFGALLAAVDGVNESFSFFKSMNPDFDSLPGGSQLQYRIKKASEKANEVSL